MSHANVIRYPREWKKEESTGIFFYGTERTYVLGNAQPNNVEHLHSSPLSPLHIHCNSSGTLSICWQWHGSLFPKSLDGWAVVRVFYVTLCVKSWGELVISCSFTLIHVCRQIQICIPRDAKASLKVPAASVKDLAKGLHGLVAKQTLNLNTQPYTKSEVVSFIASNYGTVSWTKTKSHLKEIIRQFWRVGSALD